MNLKKLILKVVRVSTLMIKWKLRMFILVIFYQTKNHTKIISIYDVSHRNIMGEKTLRIWLNKIDGFIKIDNRIRYLILDHSRFDKTCGSIKDLISKKVVLQIVLIIILHESELIHIIIYLLKKKKNFHNVIILIKSAVNKDKNNYYCNIFLEKGNRYFLVALCRLIAKRPNLEVMTKRLLHQQLEIPGQFQCHVRAWKCVPTATSGGVDISEVPGCHLLRQMNSH